jgi:hypothetical protein
VWSSGQSFWLHIQRAWFDSRRYQIFWEVVGLERSPLSLVGTIEELLRRSAFVNKPMNFRVLQNEGNLLLSERILTSQDGLSSTESLLDLESSSLYSISQLNLIYCITTLYTGTYINWIWVMKVCFLWNLFLKRTNGSAVNKHQAGNGVEVIIKCIKVTKELLAIY